jgi:3',5'-cyclic AMP phosphodiesterase CpdA
MSSAARLLAISDLHLGHRANREALERLGAYPEDWLALAGDVGESPAHLERAIQTVTPRFARVIWTPGNHELWSPPGAEPPLCGQARYDALVDLCRGHGVLTPEDDYPEWPGVPGLFIVPLFLLFDYSFRPPGIAEADAVAWARETGVLSADERLLDPHPFPSRAAWCHHRCALARARLDALPADAETILINHWPLRYDLARPPRIPRFSIWCGTSITEDWSRRYRARAVVSGHLHLRTTLWRHGVRFEEVSLGYPRDWRADRGINWYLREILPGPRAGAERFMPPRDPFVSTPVSGTQETRSDPMAR